jgi:hypothetical protein
MKNLFVLLLLAFTASIYAQELDSLKTIMDKKNAPEKVESQDDSSFAPVIIEEDGDQVKVKIMDKEVVKVIESGDSTYVKVGDKGIIRIIDQPDSTRIRVGDKEISIVERDGDSDIDVYDVDDDDDDNSIRNPKFRGHWAGIESGINNFLDDGLTISREGDNLFMDLNTGRSWAINLNFAQYSLGFGTSHFGAVTGLGLEYNNYFFDGDNTIEEKNDFVVGLDTIGVSKSKLTTSFLRVPLIFEVQFPHTIRAKRVFISAGIVAGLKLGSHTKVVYKDDNGKSRDKNNDDFNINPFRYGLTARIGFSSVSIFGDYYFTPMFVKDKGPELHPFTVGLAVSL